MRPVLRLLLLPLALAGALGVTHAQGITVGWNPRTGDTWVDAQLADINRYGSRYRDPFIDEIVRYHGAPRDLVSDLLRRHWAPGDVYFACALAQLVGRPCRVIAEEWERDHGLGWGELAKRYGIKPGSPEFHRLKRGFVPSYDRWGRPLELDPQLRADFPGRGKGVQGKGGKPGGERNDAPSKRSQGKPRDAGAGHGNGHGKPAKGGGKGKGKG